MKKMNNKGFSLVELIVVVLIMAIIAVALAPQVMKWVENSRKSTDVQNYDSVVEAVNVALTDKTTLGNSFGKSMSMTSAGWADAAATGGSQTWTTGLKTAVDSQVQGILGSSWATDLKIRSEAFGTSTFYVGVTSAGTVERIAAPDADAIS